MNDSTPTMQASDDIPLHALVPRGHPMPSSPVTTKDKPSSELNKDRLRDAVNLYYRGCLWTLNWCRDKDTEGFVLDADDLQLLDMDLADVMRQLAAAGPETALHPPLDYWAHAVEAFAYRPPLGRLRWAAPGDDIPAGSVIEHVQFRSHPKHLPFCDVRESLRYYGEPLGLNIHKLLFRLDRIIVGRAAHLQCSIEMLKLDTMAIGKSLHQWRDATLARIDSAVVPAAPAPAAEPPQAVEVEESTPQALRGLTRSRPELAKAMGKTVRTLKRWDKIGCVPTGKQWHKPVMVNKNSAMYAIDLNWLAILSMMPEIRDPNSEQRLVDAFMRARRADENDEDG